MKTKGKVLDHKRHTNLNQQQKQNIPKVLSSKKNKLEEMSCTTYLKNIDIQSIR